MTDLDKPKKENIQYYVKFSFNMTYIFLLTTATITFIEAMRTSNPTVRHVLNLETAISVIAGYFYSIFLQKIAMYEKENLPIDWEDVVRTRYIDWSMTTPLMLLALCLTLSTAVGKTLALSTISLIIVLNFAMLYIGYLGETGDMNKWVACIVGFIPLVIMFGVIYKKFVSNFSNKIIFGIFVSLWSLYGVVYMFDDLTKNMAMNILDCLAKCLFGLGLWAYFSKIIVLK
jgi:bacteriorhodopsin